MKKSKLRLNKQQGESLGVYLLYSNTPKQTMASKYYIGIMIVVGSALTTNLIRLYLLNKKKEKLIENK